MAWSKNCRCGAGTKERCICDCDETITGTFETEIKLKGRFICVAGENPYAIIRMIGLDYENRTATLYNSWTKSERMFKEKESVDFWLQGRRIAVTLIDVFSNRASLTVDCEAEDMTYRNLAPMETL